MNECKNCKKETKNNRVFCSEDCNESYYLKTRIHIKKSTKNCQHCNKQTDNPRFCSRKCSAYKTNKERHPESYHCFACNKKLSDKWIGKKYCDECRYTKNPNFVNWDSITLAELKTRVRNTYQFHARIRDLARRIYKKSNKPKICYNCGYKLYYEVCHIISISDFPLDTPVSKVNHIDNLIAFCRNCHWEFDNEYLKIDFKGADSEIASLVKNL